jgi:hypothetical protein
MRRLRSMRLGSGGVPQAFWGAAAFAWLRSSAMTSTRPLLRTRTRTGALAALISGPGQENWSSSGASVVSGLTQSLAYPQEREQTAGIPAGGSADYATISPGDSSQPMWMFVKVDEPGAGGDSFDPTEAARRFAPAPWAPRCSANTKWVVSGALPWLTRRATGSTSSLGRGI